jgi:hypothetical protein
VTTFLFLHVLQASQPRLANRLLPRSRFASLTPAYSSSGSPFMEWAGSATPRGAWRLNNATNTTLSSEHSDETFLPKPDEEGGRDIFSPENTQYACKAENAPNPQPSCLLLMRQDAGNLFASKTELSHHGPHQRATFYPSSYWQNLCPISIKASSLCSG